MASPYKISIGVNIDPSGAKSGGAASQQAISAIGAAAEKVAPKITAISAASEQTATKIQQLIAVSTGLHSGAANENARRWTGALADEGLALDKLRAKYNPVYAAIQQFQQARLEIKMAYASGAISVDEYTAALSRERQATLASIDAIKGRNVALQEGSGFSNQRFQSANLAFQAQDIITTAPFMPWYTVALQQGPQVAAVLDSLENKSAGLAAAFTSLISPWSLLSIAVVGATAYAIQYFSQIEWGGAKSQEALQAELDLIDRVVQKWGSALPAMKAYADERQKLTDGKDIKEAAAAEADKQWSELRSTVGDLRIDFADLAVQLDNVRPDWVAPATREFQALAKGIEDGTATAENAKTAQAALLDLAENTGIPVIKDFAAQVGALGTALGVAATNANKAKTEAAVLVDLINRMPALGTLSPIISGNGRFMTDANEIQTYRAEQEANKNPFVTNSDGRTVPVPLPGSKPSPLGEEPSRRAASAASSAANAYRDLVKSADDRVAQMKLEAQLAGESGIAAEALRFKLDLLQQSEDKGRSLTPQQVDAINQRVEAFKRYAEEAAKATLKADLLFEREQMGRSAFDQQIASTLKNAGLEVDLDSYEAGLIRTNLQLQYMRDLAGDFTSTFFNGIEQGKSILESLGDAGVNALKRIADTLLNDVLNSLFQVNNAGGGGLFSSLFSGIFGGGASADPWAGLRSVGSFSGGGYTGPGGIHQPRGVVHAGEIVWSQRDIARNGGVQTVEAMRLGRKGYANGGAVDVSPLYQAQSYSSRAAEQAVIKLKLSLGLTSDGALNIMPDVRRVVAEDAPRYALEVVEDFNANHLPDRVADINQNPRKR